MSAGVFICIVNQCPRGANSTTENISFQESRTGDSLTVDPTVVHSEIANVSDEFSQDDHFDLISTTSRISSVSTTLCSP